METTRGDTLGRPMNRNSLGREGGGRLFTNRRQRDWTRGLLSNMGHYNDYLVFQPAKYFTRVLGDSVLRLNDALAEVRSRGAELIPSVGVARLQAHYAGLDKLIEATRDKLLGLTEYCNKGFEGHFGEALESIEPAAANTPETADGQPADSSEAYLAAAAAKTTGMDVFDALRQRQFSQGILTEFGRDQGCVAFQPSSFYGRFLGELVYSLNDALRRLEGNTSYYVISGDGDTLQNYYLELEDGLTRIGKDLEGIIAFCSRKVA